MALSVVGSPLNTSLIPGLSLQGNSAPLQGSSPNLQGSSPKLQVTVAPTTRTVLPDIPGANTTTETTQAAPVNPNNTAQPTFADKSGDISTNQALLDSLPGTKASGLAGIQAALAKVLGSYGTDSDNYTREYTDNSNANKSNLESNTQAALLNASRGRQGLFGVLAGLGALNGSGIDLANNAVREGANADLGTANDTYGTNQSALDQSIGDFNLSNEARKKEAGDSATAATTALENSTLTTEQQAKKAIADDYAAEGNKAQSDAYQKLVAALYPQIGQTVNAAPAISYTPTPYTAPTLNKYVGGSSRTATTVATIPGSGDNPIPGLVAVPGLKKATA